MSDSLRRELEKERALLEALKSDRIRSQVWVDKQREFMNSKVRERIISGGNQLGKSICVVALTAMHLCGEYPDWYKGDRFDKGVDWAVAGPTWEATKDNLLERLFGPDYDGTGWLPAHTFTKPTERFPRKIDVRHSSSHTSTLRVFSYDQGARRIQGRTLNGVTFDESPKLEVVEELSQRLNATRGLLLGAVSPKEDGAVEIIEMFESTPGLRKVFYYGINDATWMPPDQRAEIITKNEFNPLAEATLHGRPVARIGLVYKTPQDFYTYEDKPLVGGKSIIGIDLPHSSGHFAAVRMTLHEGRWHVEREWKCAGLTIDEYAEAVREMGGGQVPVAWPHDGGRQMGDGTIAAEAYANLGLNMLPVHAHMVGRDGKKHRSVVAVVEELALALSNGNLVVSSDCLGLLRELHRYRWKEGKPGTKPRRADDHLHDALCKAWMMRVHASAASPSPPLTSDNSGIAAYFSKSYNPLGARYGRRNFPWRLK